MVSTFFCHFIEYFFCSYFMEIWLQTLTFSAHGEGGNSGGIDGRGKFAYNELFLMHIVTTCSIR